VEWGHGFRLDTILTTANDLKYTRAIQTKISEWMINPTEDVVRLLAADLFGAKRFTPFVKDQFTAITKRAFEQFLSERINERLKGAMATESSTIVEKPATTKLQPDSANLDEPSVHTSGEEVEGFHVVRAIVRDLVSTRRVVMRDAYSYCAILLDDNNRKPICRLRFNNIQRLKLGIFNPQREEEQVALEAVDDLYNYAEQIRATVVSYLGGSDVKPAVASAQPISPQLNPLP